MIDKLVKLFLVSAIIGASISYSKVYLFHIALILLFSYTVYNFKIIDIYRTYKDNYRYLVFFIFFICWYIISILWTISPLLYALQYNIYIFMGVFIVATILIYVDTIDKLNSIFKILSLVFIIEIVLSLMEIHPDFRLPISPHSTIVHYFGRDMISHDISDLSIPTGFNWNRNDFAVVMVMILPFVLFSKNILLKIILSISIFILVYSTDSRGALLDLIIVFGIYIIINKKRALISILSLVILIPILFNSDYKIKIQHKYDELSNILTGFMGTGYTGDGAITTRNKLISNGIEALKNSNYIGVGVGGSIEVQKRAGGVYPNFYKKDEPYYKKHYTGILSMHNFLVELLVDGGIIFFIVFLIWYFSILKKLYFIINNTTEQLKMYASGSFLSMIAFLVATPTPSSMIYILPMWVLFGFTLSIIKLWDENEKNNSLSR